MKVKSNNNSNNNYHSWKHLKLDQVLKWDQGLYNQDDRRKDVFKAHNVLERIVGLFTRLIMITFGIDAILGTIVEETNADLLILMIETICTR